MQRNIKVTISLPQATNTMAEKLKSEMNISKSEVFAKALNLLAREQRMEKIKKGCAQMVDYYKNDPEVREWQELDMGYRETIAPLYFQTLLPSRYSIFVQQF